MGLILKDKIRKFMVGFPTVSDKYNVAGGILAGSTPVNFGDLVQYDTTTGYYKPATSLSAITDVAGFVLGTNVKLAEGFASDVVRVNGGEAFNLLMNGYIAIQLDSGATEAYITPNATVCVILATGKVTTSDKAASTTIVQLPGVVLTGEYEKIGSTLIVEALVK